jgi:hypothetical protein
MGELWRVRTLVSRPATPFFVWRTLKTSFFYVREIRTADYWLLAYPLVVVGLLLHFVAMRRTFDLNLLFIGTHLCCQLREHDTYRQPCQQMKLDFEHHAWHVTLLHLSSGMNW